MKRRFVLGMIAAMGVCSPLLAADYKDAVPYSKKRVTHVQTHPADQNTRVYNSANLLIEDSVATALTFDAERWDTDELHQASVTPSRLTAQTDGQYLIFGHVVFASDPDGYRQMDIRLNGTTSLARVIQDGTAIPGNALTITTYYNLAANDYVELVVYQTAGASLAVLADQNISPEFGMVKQPSLPSDPTAPSPTE